MSLEEEFWTGLKEIAQLRAITMVELIVQIDAARDHNNLIGYSPIRADVLSRAPAGAGIIVYVHRGIRRPLHPVGATAIFEAGVMSWDAAADFEQRAEEVEMDDTTGQPSD